jgi:hypothetical protein
MRILLLLLALVGATRVSAQCPRSDPTRKYVLWADHSGGLQDRSRFDSALGIATRSFTSIAQVRPQPGVRGPRVTPQVRALVEAAMAELVSDVEAQSGRTYPQRNLVADFIESWQNRGPAYRGPRDVYITRIEEEVRCVDAEVTVRVHGVYALVPRVVDTTVVAGAIRAIDRSELIKLERDGRGGGSVSINIYNIIDQARANQAVQDELKRGVERFYRLPQSELRLQLADDYSRSLVEHVRNHDELSIEGFDSGEYGISSFMVGVIERIVVPELASILRRSQGVVDVVSIGHTDRAAVRTSIDYRGCADLSKALGQRMSFDFRAPCPPSRRIANNDQLSLARGYEGIALLARVFPAELPRARVRLGYSGAGSSQASTNFVGSRRIVYRITVQRLQD